MGRCLRDRCADKLADGLGGGGRRAGRDRWGGAQLRRQHQGPEEGGGRRQVSGESVALGRESREQVSGVSLFPTSLSGN